MEDVELAMAVMILQMCLALLSHLQYMHDDDEDEDDEEEDSARLMTELSRDAVVAVRTTFTQRRWWVLEQRETWSEDHVEWLPDDLFRAQLRVGKKLFQFICRCAMPYMYKEDTRWREAVPVKRKVAMALKRLATGMNFVDVGYLFRHGKTTVVSAFEEFCRFMSTTMMAMAVRWPTRAQALDMNADFRKLHGIPGIMGAIVGSFIPIDTPRANPEHYYCRKQLHAVLLQAIFSSTGYIWDFHCGWAGSLHNYNLFYKTPASRRIVAGELYGFKLLGDAAYPPRAWMLPPYKSPGEAGFEPFQADFNYRQSATRMPIKRTFGILKARWRCLHMVTGLVHKVPAVVAALSSMCALPSCARSSRLFLTSC